MPLKVTSVIRNQGLDTNGAVPWQMVPLNGSKNVKISGTSGLTPKVRDPKKLKITLTGSTLKLDGVVNKSAKVLKIKKILVLWFVFPLTLNR